MYITERIDTILSSIALVSLLIVAAKYISKWQNKKGVLFF